MIALASNSAPKKPFNIWGNKTLKKLIFILIALFFVGCGASENDKIAAKRGCSLAKSYKAAKKAPNSLDAKMLEQRMENFKTASQGTNKTNVTEEMKKLCPDDYTVLSEAVK